MVIQGYFNIYNLNNPSAFGGYVAKDYICRKSMAIENMDKKYTVWAIVVALSLALVGTGVWIFLQQKEMNEFKEQVEIEKQQAELEQQRNELEQGYSELLTQYEFEGKRMTFNNDSLLEKLDAEKIKVQRLLEELQTVKSTNAARIAELRKELTTLKGVMRHYVAQIDSLNKANQRLREENAQVTRRYKEVSETANQLKQEHEALTEKVTLAAKLDAVGVTATPLTSRGKVAKRIKKTEKIKIAFTISKNVTAEVGEKYIYVRIVKPDGDVLVKDRADLFPFEGQEINYSCRKLIEFTGDEIRDVALYWDVEEFLYPGDYRVEIFADNYLIGSGVFALKE